MTSLLLSNSDVIRSIFTEKTQENAEKTQNPGNLLPPITQKIAEFLSLIYLVIAYIMCWSNIKYSHLGEMFPMLPQGFSFLKNLFERLCSTSSVHWKKHHSVYK